MWVGRYVYIQGLWTSFGNVAYFYSLSPGSIISGWWLLLCTEKSSEEYNNSLALCAIPLRFLSLFSLLGNKLLQCTVRKFTLQILRGFSASYKDARLPLSLQICVCVCTLRNLRLLLLLSLLVWMVGTITKAANLFPQEIRRKKSACLLNSTFSLFTMLKSWAFWETLKAKSLRIFWLS